LRKILCKLVNEDKATVEQQIEYYNLMLLVSNYNTECGKRMVSKYFDKLKELKKLLNGDNMVVFNDGVTIDGQFVCDVVEEFININNLDYNMFDVLLWDEIYDEGTQIYIDEFII